jgi:hypothetical protein
MAKKKFTADEKFTGALFALVTRLRDYQLGWLLNRELNFKLERKDDLEIHFPKKNKTAFFSCLRYESEEDKFLLHVFSNKYHSEFLVPEIKQADFIFKLNGELSRAEITNYMRKLRSLESLQLVVELDWVKLKSKSNLLAE